MELTTGRHTLETLDAGGKAVRYEIELGVDALGEPYLRAWRVEGDGRVEVRNPAALAALIVSTARAAAAFDAGQLLDSLGTAALQTMEDQVAALPPDTKMVQCPGCLVRFLVNRDADSARCMNCTLPFSLVGET